MIVQIAVSLFCLVFLGLLIIIFRKSRTGYNEIDEKYGKPYQAKLVKMVGGHPELKQGSMAVSLHPKDAIAFNRKVFLFSQINSIKIITQLPERYRKSTGNSRVEEQYLCLAIADEYGLNEVIFTTKSDFYETANQLIQKWKKYNL